MTLKINIRGRRTKKQKYTRRKNKRTQYGGSQPLSQKAPVWTFTDDFVYNINYQLWFPEKKKSFWSSWSSNTINVQAYFKISLSATSENPKQTDHKLTCQLQLKKCITQYCIEMDEQIEYMINFKLYVERDIIYTIYYIDPETNDVILIAKYIKKKLPEKEMNVFNDQKIPLPETLKLSIFEYALNSTFFHSVVECIILIYDRQQYELNEQRLQKEKEERLQKEKEERLQKEKEERLQKEKEQTTYNSSTSTNTTTTQDSNEYQRTAAITYQPYNGISSDQWRQDYDS